MWTVQVGELGCRGLTAACRVDQVSFQCNLTLFVTACLTAKTQLGFLIIVDRQVGWPDGSLLHCWCGCVSSI